MRIAKITIETERGMTYTVLGPQIDKVAISDIRCGAPDYMGRDDPLFGERDVIGTRIELTASVLFCGDNALPQVAEALPGTTSSKCLPS